MEAHKCDRCGEYVDGNEIPQIMVWGCERAKVIGTPRIKMELCPVCFDALEEFLLNKKKDEEELKLCDDCKYVYCKMTEAPCNSCDLSFSNFVKKGAEDGI